MTERSDEELRARFSELRAGDELSAPRFGAVVEQAARAGNERVPAAIRWRIPVALSIAAALLLAVSLARATRRHDFIAPPLSTWTSPTASLLRMPGSNLLASPMLGSSALDNLTTTLAQRERK